MNKFRIFILQRLPHKSDSLLLQLLLGTQEEVGGLFQKVSSKPFVSLVHFTNDISEADFVIMPHNYFHVYTNTAYIRDLEGIALKYNKKMIVFAYGDSSEDIHIKSSIILRTSKYRHTLRPNEIIIPPFVEDLGVRYGIEYQIPRHNAPIIGFAGQAAFSVWHKYVVYMLKVLIMHIKIVFRLKVLAALPGIYFRRRIWHSLRNSKSIIPRFLIRNTFSAHKNTVGDNPTLIRSEFVQNIKDSDLSLAIKGDGNYSLRFFEILSLGRIPLLIDTDIVLPLEQVIDYDQIVHRINVCQLKQLESNVAAWYTRNTADMLVERRRKARTLFESFLSPAAFYLFLFTDVRSPLYLKINLDN